MWRRRTPRQLNSVSRRHTREASPLALRSKERVVVPIAISNEHQQASKHLAARAAPLGLHREARGGRGAQRGDRGHEGRAAGHEGEEDSDDLQRKASLNQQLCLTDESTPTDASTPRWLRAECTRRQAAGPCEPALFFSGCLSAVNYCRPSTLNPPIYNIHSTYRYMSCFCTSS